MIMARNLCLWFLTLTTLLTFSMYHVIAYSELENWIYMDKIIDLLNNKNECLLPTYEEIDELQSAIKELQAIYGDSFESELNPDQKLILATVLDQWPSFQRRMTSAIVIRSAKKRSFICRIEEYQTKKYGFSICTNLKDISSAETDKIFERNPLVRYIKHIQTKKVDQFEPKVIHTRIEYTREDLDLTYKEEVQNVEQLPNESNPNERTPLIENDSYDPLTKIPVPTAHDQRDEILSKSRNKENNHSPSIADPATTINTEGAGTVPNNQTTTNFHTDPKVEKNNISSNNTGEPEPKDQPIPTGELETVVELMPEVQDEPDLEKHSVVVPESPIEQQIPIPTTPPLTGVDELAANLPEPKEEAKVEDIKLEPIDTKKPQKPAIEFDEYGAELVDIHQDNLDLNRLNDIESNGWRLNNNAHDDLIWPDENPGQICHLDDFIKNKWTILLKSKPTLVDSNDNEEDLPKKKLKNRRKEFLNSVQVDNRLYETGVKIGTYDYHPEIPGEAKKKNSNDHWVKIIDGNFCKIGYNRDYLKQSRFVQNMNSWFPKNDQIKKKSLIS